MAVLEMRNITKTFPGVIANRQACLSMRAGEIHALVGENGAGKSTLMKIAAGIIRPDSGEIFVDGNVKHFRSAQDAFASGISAVHQEFMLVNSLTVLENVVLGLEPHAWLGFLDKRRASREVQDLTKKYGMDIPLSEKVGSLPVAVRQHVEIIKALFKNTKILILDEPTAVLTPQESDELFGALRNLKMMGTTIIFVTHKLNEVMLIADRVTVMRMGEVLGTQTVSEVTEEGLARLMVGREIVFRINRLKKEIVVNAPIMEIANIEVERADGYRLLRNISFKVNRGEILGLAGVAGNGQAELVELITAYRKPTVGEIRVPGCEIGFLSTRQFRESSSYVCQDRQQVGSSPKQTLWENVLIGLQAKKAFSNSLGILKRKSIYTYTRQIIQKYDVRTPSIFVASANLSGGNLQKLILGRELAKNPSFLLAEDPTRGLDVGATEYIRNQILAYAAAGNGVLLVSQDLNELLMLSDRIIVIFNGELVGQMAGNDATAEEVGLYMMGLRKASVAAK